MEVNLMKKMLIYIVIAIFALIIGVVGNIAMTFNMDFSPETLANAFTHSTTWIIAIVFFVLAAGCTLLMKKPSNFSSSSKIGEGKNAEGETLREYADSRWVTKKELEAEKRFRFCKYSKLSTFHDDGIMIRNELDVNKKDLSVNMYKPIHSLIFGTTGSGKTQTFVMPSIFNWTRCASKPSIIVSDPKGELYGKTANNSKKNGYNVIVLNLRDPYSSKRWNPMEKAYDDYHRALNLNKEVKKMVGGKPNPKEYRLMNEAYGDEWFAFNGVAYPNENFLQQDLLATRNELITKAQRSLTDLAMSICPIQNQKDPSWEQGAQKFIEGIANAMLEDSADPTLNLTKEKFNPYNLAKICCHKDIGDDEYASVKAYIQNRPRDSKALALASTAVMNAPGTTKSYMGIVVNSLSIYQDTGIQYLTSGTDIDFSKVAYEPTIFYMIIPDEDKTRHGLATICISQLYKSLIEEAVKCKPEEPELPKNVYFLLDEFANIPKIPDFTNLITVGRSRRIFFCLIVQSYSQLDAAYGEQDAETIRGNCNIKIYIGSDDMKTRENISKLCGDTSIEISKQSVSKDKNNSQSGVTQNKELKQRPLIFPDELGRLDMELNVVKIFNEFPMKNTFSPTFKCSSIYDLSQVKEAYVPKKAFNPQDIYFDFQARNRKVGGGGLGAGDMFDDIFD